MGYPVISKHFSACFMHPQLGENMYPRARGSLCFCVLLLSLQLTLFAQSDLGTISGFVRDQSGAIIPNAKVIVRNQSGIERAVNTNDSGFYIITNIPAGFYTLNVEAPGFQKYQSNNNKLDPSTRLSIDVPLTVGTATRSIEVTANRSEEHTSELQSHSFISYAVFCL